jgi:two-component system LytT family response regulator
MSKINVLIVDDEPKCIDTLTVLLKEFRNDITILDAADAVKTALPLIEKHQGNIDILFLDIQMPGGDGFTLLQRIPHIDFKVIFTTAHDKYAIQAIKFSALDYLLKPIDNSELQLSIEKFRELKKVGLQSTSINDFKKALEHKNVFEKLAVPTPAEIRFIQLDKILYLESDNNYTTLHLEGKQHLVSSKNIGYYEDLLASLHFFRIHNSYLVNVKKIDRFLKGKNGSVQLENGVVLDVSGRRKDDLLNLLKLS